MTNLSDIVAGHMGKTYGDDKHGCHRNCPACAQKRLWEWIERRSHKMNTNMYGISLGSNEQQTIRQALGMEVK